MPQEAKTELPVPQQEVETTSDYEHLEGARLNIYRKLRSARIPRSAKEFLVARIFENSPEDGDDISDFLGISSDDRIYFVTKPEFIAKNADFCRRLAYRLEEYGLEESEMGDLNRLKVGSEPLSSPSYAAPATPKLSGSSLSLMKEIDDYYDQLRQTRRVRELEGDFDSRSKAQKIAEEVLEKEKRVLTPHYYTGPIKDLLGKVDEPELLADLIEQDALERILVKTGFSFKDDRVKKILGKALYRPLDVVDSLQKEEAEKSLVREIEVSIRARGYKEGEFSLELDEATNKYKVLSKEKDRKSEVEGLERKNLKLIDKFESTVVVDLDLPEWAELKARCEEEIKSEKPSKRKEIRKRFSELKCNVRFVDGLVYKVMYTAATVTSHGYIYFPDGSRSGLVGALDSFEMEKAGGELRYHYYDKEHRIIINYGGKELVGSKFWMGIKATKSKGKLYQIIPCESFNINDHSDNPHTHTFDLKVNGKVERSFVGRYVEMPPGEIDGNLVYIVHGQNMTQDDFIYTGEAAYGPYRDLVFDYESKDEMVFCGSRVDGTTFVYFDGKEHDLQITDKQQEIVKVKNKIYIKWSKKDFGRDCYVTDELGNIVSDTYPTGIRIGKCTDGFCHLGINDQGEQIFHREGKEDKKFPKNDYVKFGTFQNKDVGVVAGNGKAHITDFEGSTISIPSVSKKGAKFRSEISDDAILIGYQDKDEQYRIYRYAEEFSLTSEETQKLALLNTLQVSTAEGIERYFAEYYGTDESGALEKLKRIYTQSKSFAGKINDLLQSNPEAGRESIAGKRTQDVNRVIDSVVSSIFPEITTNLAKARSSARREYNPPFRGRGAYFGGRLGEQFMDGDPRESYSIDFIHLREPIHEFLSTGIYAELGRDRVTWESVGFPISERFFGPTKEITAELEIDGLRGLISLPKSCNSRILLDRIKGLKSNGREVSLKGKVNALGEVTVDPPEGVTKVLYSQTVQELPLIPDDISTSEYEYFKSVYERSFGNKISERIVQMPEEWKLFLQSIKQFRPVEKLVAIEEFVREIGYYDLDNREMQPHKQKKNIAENVVEMSERMKELKRRFSGDRIKLERKKYAGVCSDFAKMTIALLREAGFISGIAGGFKPNGEDLTITSKQAHAVAYVLWPTQGDEAHIITIDGTPGGMNAREDALLGGTRMGSLRDKLKLFNEMKEKVTANAGDYMKELDDLLANLDEESIKKLQNGKLEQFLNAILSRVKESNLSVVKNVLNASRYGGTNFASMLDGKDIGAEIAFRKFLEGEVKRERSAVKEDNYFKGEELLRTIEDFINRYSKDKDIGGRQKAIEIVERVIEMAGKYLNPIETKSVAAIITYLRAKRMR